MQRNTICIALLVVVLHCFQSLQSISANDNIVSALNHVAARFGQDLESFLGLVKKPIEDDVTFWCATPTNYELVQLLPTDDECTIEYKLDTSLELAFLIHGWTDSRNESWIRRLVDNYLNYNDANICVVDWSRLAFMLYDLSADATLPVGNYLGSFIQNLTSNGTFPISNITLIGHSMGAHVAGVAGYTLNGSVPRIIGLSPAGPDFTKFTVKPLSQRLDQTDAEFVQVIHTDRYFIGSNVDLGHEDYYPNGGAAPQPGCEVSPNNDPIDYLNIFCSHWKAYEYFITSLNPEKMFTGTECANYFLYRIGACEGNPTDNFGLYARKVASDRLFLLIDPSLM